MTDTAAPTPQPDDISDAPGATPNDKPIPTQPIVATYGRYYRNARYIMVAALFAMAGWFAYDGWVKWPAQNVRIEEVTAEIARISSSDKPEDRARLAELDKEKKELGDLKDGTDILTQKLLALGLPALGLAYLAFVIYRSRGTFVLDNNTLTAPGHPPVPIEAMKDIDGKLWRKKGIAFVGYQNIEGKSGRIRLDAFIYSPKPMDDMYEIIARHHGIWEQTKPLPPVAKK
jgi:hypothetical protein